MPDIPLQPENQDIFSLGFDKSLNRPIEDNSTGVVYDTIQNALNSGSMLSGGNLNLKTLTIGGLVKQVAPGDDINAAIDAVNREGGGTVQLLAKTYTLTQNINLKSNVALVGAGVDLTILDFNNTGLGISSSGNSPTFVENIRLEEFTVKNSTSITGNIFLFESRYFKVRNIKSKSATNVGIYISECTDFIIENVTATSNTGDGFFLEATNIVASQRFTFLNSTADTNGGDGFAISAGTNDLAYGSFVGCRAASNTGDGFDFVASGGSALDTTLTGCVANSNGGIGFDVDSNCQRISFVNCFAELNTGDGFEIDGLDCLIVGCNSQDPIDINSSNIIVANHLLQSGSPQTDLSITESDTISYLNQGESNRTIRRIMQAKNTLATDLRTGNVVILDATADGESITTTTTNGHTRVYGVVDEAITAGSYGRVHTEGYSTLVYAVNGTSSLAIGDFLSTYSHAYYAKKAVSGEIAFAICLEAPTTGTAQVDALLITPRQI